GETIDNTVEVINASHLQATAGISTQPIELSASEFFYGDSILNLVEAVRASGLRDRTDVAAQLNGRLAPEIFYGYSDVIAVDNKCADC
nr:hypothetical protein [Desulfobacteraceae bacterium]